MNFQFGEGPKGPKASWDYTNETSKCDTGKLYFFTHNYSTFKAPYIVYYIYIIRTKVSVPDIRYRSTYIKAKRPIFPAFRASTSLSYCNPQTCRNKQKTPSPLPVCTGGMGGQCHTCSSHSYNPNLPSGPSGPHQIGNYTS